MGEGDSAGSSHYNANFAGMSWQGVATLHNLFGKSGECINLTHDDDGLSDMGVGKSFRKTARKLKERMGGWIYDEAFGGAAGISRMQGDSLRLQTPDNAQRLEAAAVQAHRLVMSGGNNLGFSMPEMVDDQKSACRPPVLLRL